jgi:hypothetical protein
MLHEFLTLLLVSLVHPERQRLDSSHVFSQKAPLTSKIAKWFTHYTTNSTFAIIVISKAVGIPGEMRKICLSLKWLTISNLIKLHLYAYWPVVSLPCRMSGRQNEAIIKIFDLRHDIEAAVICVKSGARNFR